LDLPVSLHILTGYDYALEVYKHGSDLPNMGTHMYRVSINQKLAAVMDALTDIIITGVLQRYPDLKLVLVENEVAWLPFFIDQLDYYFLRFPDRAPQKLDRTPSEFFASQISATFFRDPNALLSVARL